MIYNNRTNEDRKADALRKKWLEQVNLKIPTGDPNIPEHVRIAKKLFRIADQAAEVGQGDPTDDIDSDDSGKDSSNLEGPSRERSATGVIVSDRKKRARFTTQLGRVDDKFSKGTDSMKSILSMVIITLLIHYV